MDAKKLEKYSSAITLSDMEVFVFPELMYSLVLANIMSPIIWRWRDEDCFRRLEGKSPYKKLMRLKQYIMDEYEFNLDLNTWGLTHKDVELRRFEPFIRPEDIARSNALFGYTGDKYYFDVDIRRHFGLDKYDGDIIPYWKTETVEAMDAFRFKDGYSTGAGECVSLSTLYAAAAFVVCGIPLEDIFLVLTPLHSQNFIDTQEGVLTNNRRLVTKSMWFNGTAISDKSQRALRNEQVTIVAHSTGWTHCLYDQATIDPAEYRRFTERLGRYLAGEFDSLMFANFLRSRRQYQRHFQFCRQRRGQFMFVAAEVLFGYEHGSNFRIADNTFDKLLGEVSDDDYSPYKAQDRLCCEQLMAFVRYEKIDIAKQQGRGRLAEYLSAFVPEAVALVEDLYAFVHLEPKLPGDDREYIETEPIRLDASMGRDEVIDYLSGMREVSETADLAFYAYRDMDSCNWRPFANAAMQRCPVSVQACKNKTVEQAYQWLGAMANASVYDGRRLAQPDEVVNYGTGDGIEKAFALANIICAKDPARSVELIIDGANVSLRINDGADASAGVGVDYRFSSVKGITKTITLSNRDD